MYIRKVEIKNIKSISNFEMEFSEPAGWHVLIGDNGSGKSTILKSISASILGSNLTQGIISLDWNEMLNNDSGKGSCKIKIQQHRHTPVNSNGFFELGSTYGFTLTRNRNNVLITNEPARSKQDFEKENGFSIAFGPFRRFSGNTKQADKVSNSRPLLSAHYSLFDEDTSFYTALEWIEDVYNRWLREKESTNYLAQEPKAKYSSFSSEELFNNLKTFINQSGLLPHNTKFDRVDIDGDLLFVDGNGYSVKIGQLSDGFRSFLSLAFELLRQLVRVFGESAVFDANYQKDTTIGCPGVVLIDEIDSHLHPSWQTRIGQWFTKYFPKIQFIVTTHSPLVCRACSSGTIWRLAAPGSNITSGEITGLDKNRLIYGNILDAYGTEVFGTNVSISDESNEKMNRLAELNIKSILGDINDDEQEDLQRLKSIIPTLK